MKPPSTQIPDRQLSPLWSALESYFHRTYHIQPVTDDPTCLFAYNLFEHKGPDVLLKDGETVKNGEFALELHFRREALLPMIRSGEPTRMGLELIRQADRDMPHLARALETDPALAKVKAVHALTLFHRGVTRYGFEIQPMREWYLERWFTWWHRVLMARDHAHGQQRVQAHLHKLVTKHIWISSSTLIARYGQNGTFRRKPEDASSPGK